MQLHLVRQGRQELNRRTLRAGRRPLPDGDRVIIYPRQCFALMEMTRSLEGKARRRVLAKARPLVQDDLGRDAKPERA